MSVLLTIGLPVYNGELYLEEAVNSLLNQTFTEFTLVISDNGSTDSTPHILSRLAATDSRIELRRSDVNRGGAWNFNAVAQDVTTPFYKMAAHDDLYDPRYLEVCLNVLLTEPDVIAAHTRTRYIDDTGEEITRSFRHESFGDAQPSSRLRGVLFSGHDYSYCFSVIRTAAHCQVRPWQPGYVADGVWLAELALQGRMVQLPEHLFANRLHPQRSWAAYGKTAGKIGIQSWWGGPDTLINRTPTWSALSQFWSAVSQSPVTGRERRRCQKLVLQWARWSWRGLTKELAPDFVRRLVEKARS